MSRRGRAREAAISLFSFQDIITSVTAIMILLVLILTLELITRTQQKGVAAADRQVARDLRQAVEDLERRADALEAELATLQSSARQSATFSEEETRRREQEAAARAARLAEEIALAETRLRQAASARRQAEAALVDVPAAAPDESAEHVAALDARAAEIEEANRRERDRQAQAKAKPGADDGAPTLLFNRPAGETLRPRLVEVSGDGVAVLAGEGEELRQFRGLLGAAEFDRWLASLDRSSEYVVVILRPSGIGRYDKVLKAVKAAGLGVGAEMVGESMPVALAEGGS